jgi:hypothetical protein
MSIYTEFGYESRRNYLESLADDHGVDLETVMFLSSVLGPSEDFDGLVSAVQDIAEETD